MEDGKKSRIYNVNIDLISAIPGQTKKSWETTLRTVAQLQPEHISAYSLIIEEGTVFGTIYGEDGERYAKKNCCPARVVCRKYQIKTVI